MRGVNGGAICVFCGATAVLLVAIPSNILGAVALLSMVSKFSVSGIVVNNNDN